LEYLSKHFPKSVIDSIRNYPSSEEMELDKYISFDTKVQVLSDFFGERADKIADKA
jgi:hypothetical protein